MRQPESKRAITRDRYDAVLLDLDGVITDTANLHAACWKQMFDEYLQTRATQRGEAFRPSSSPRTTGSMWTGSPDTTAFATFSLTRNPTPRGPPDDPPRAETGAGSGTARTSWSTKSLKRRGGAEGSVKSSISSAVGGSNRRRHLKSELRGRLKGRQVGCLLRGASRWRDPCATPGREARPGYVLDGGKLLGVEPTRAVVIEDAISGVQAGCHGNFGLVIGVARKGNAEELQHHGAHLVVNDLGELVD